MFLIFTTGLAYLIGSIPFGYFFVKLFAGRDVREVGSGRTGGTNAMRAAGFKAGFLTTFADLFKSALSVWIAQWLLPVETQALGMALAGLAAIIGHNYSIYMGFKGGAGGAPCAGGALAMWPPSFLIIVPLGALILWGVGYASVATMSAAVIVTAIFVYRAYVLQAPGAEVAFVGYGIGSMLLLAWALRPNFQRLLRGEERLVGWRAKQRSTEK